jgi:predicted AlkP superfamily phosphohydrolase/phosphomutase
MRVLVLGLDGADWRICRPLMDQGRMPALARLVDEGAHGPLDSVIPPLSAPAWISFVLGSGPGRHGVTDFLERDARVYEGTTGHTVTSHHYPKRTLLDLAGDRGLRVASVSVPMTYPSWELNGVMVAGGFTPGDRITCTPPELAPRLDVGPLDLGSRLLELPPERQQATLRDQLERHGELVDRVLALERFDLAVAVVHAPDNAHHCFWPGDGRPPHEEPRIADLYERTDRFVGGVLDRGEWDLALVISDHGGGPRPARRLAVNRWLAELGLLVPAGSAWPWLGRAAGALKRRSPRLVRLVRTRAPNGIRRAVSGVTQSARAIAWDRTRAFGVYLFPPYVGVQVNLAGRERLGIVPADDLEEEREHVARLLREDAVRRGLPVLDVAGREEAFGREADPRLPDLVLRLEDDVEGVNALEERLLGPAPPPGPRDSQGYHSRQGILVAHGRDVRPGALEGAALVDVAPTVLAALGVPIPAAMTGRPLEEAFRPGALEVGRDDSAGDEERPGAGPAGSAPHLDEREEREILESLRGLGYVE